MTENKKETNRKSEKEMETATTEPDHAETPEIEETGTEKKTLNINWLEESLLIITKSTVAYLLIFTIMTVLMAETEAIVSLSVLTGCLIAIAAMLSGTGAIITGYRQRAITENPKIILRIIYGAQFIATGLAIVFVTLSANAPNIEGQTTSAGGLAGYIIAILIFEILMRQAFKIKENDDIEITNDVLTFLLNNSLYFAQFKNEIDAELLAHDMLTSLPAKVFEKAEPQE